jgi:hypothetical protein
MCQMDRSDTVAPLQYGAMKEAIEGWREMEAILSRMQQLTRLRIFGSLPDVRRRKPLTKIVLGVK